MENSPRPHALRAVVPCAVHQSGNPVAGHFLSRIGSEQGFQELRLEAGLQPPEIMFMAQNDRHAVVDCGDHRVGVSPPYLYSISAKFTSMIG